MAHLCVASLRPNPHTPFSSASQSAQCECVFARTAHPLFLSFAPPFGWGFAFRANTKVSCFLTVHGAMLSLFLVLIPQVFAVTCESHQRRAPKTCMCVCVCVCVCGGGEVPSGWESTGSFQVCGQNAFIVPDGTVRAFMKHVSLSLFRLLFD